MKQVNIALIEQEYQQTNIQTLKLSKTLASEVTNAPRPLPRPVQNSLILETGYRCRGIQTKGEIDNGVSQQERCHKACNQLKIPSIKLGSFSLGIEILWLANGCENGGCNGWVLVELGFKEAEPWPGNATFQFWPSFNATLQRKVAYATYGSCVRNSVQRALWMLQRTKLHAQLLKLRRQL
ncbi:hypothetical protein PIB30_078013 [Stylosanthes scabra]|uniref:Uncharacterized protein n=1 Tax=Stylosanthes scabra TaxID=79078 RepID=A0ABU6RR66_9FABA|nr:hypothetical protein [Stylosanthes scabra]